VRCGGFAPKVHLTAPATPRLVLEIEGRKLAATIKDLVQV